MYHSNDTLKSQTDLRASYCSHTGKRRTVFWCDNVIKQVKVGLSSVCIVQVVFLATTVQVRLPKKSCSPQVKHCYDTGKRRMVFGVYHCNDTGKRWALSG